MLLCVSAIYSHSSALPHHPTPTNIPCHSLRGQDARVCREVFHLHCTARHGQGRARYSCDRMGTQSRDSLSNSSNDAKVVDLHVRLHFFFFTGFERAS